MRSEKVLKWLTFLLCLTPLAYSVMQVYLLQSGASHTLGADPGKSLVHMQGEWAIRLLAVTLLITPIRLMTGWTRLQKIRRMLGLFTFFYASLHLSAYLFFLLELNFSGLVADVIKRPYITVGFSAFMLLTPLALTSTDAMVRRLKTNWAQLHRLVYPVAVLVVIHLAWVAKSSYTEAVVYGVVFAILLLARPLRSKLLLFRKRLKTAS